MEGEGAVGEGEEGVNPEVTAHRRYSSKRRDLNLGQEERWAVVEVHVALAVAAAPAVLQHVVHPKHVHGLVVLHHTTERESSVQHSYEVTETLMFWSSEKAAEGSNTTKASQLLSNRKERSFTYNKKPSAGEKKISYDQPFLYQDRTLPQDDQKADTKRTRKPKTSDEEKESRIQV